MIPPKKELINAYERVNPFVHRTPVLKSEFINDQCGADVFFKCENFQKMGAFKFRGAINAIQQLSDAQKEAGVITHSSGNFGQAMSLAAKKLGIRAYVIMPSDTPFVKKDAVKYYGGRISESDPTLESREALTREIQNKTGATFLHPSNNSDVILGQGTAAIELLEDQPELDYIFTPIGGGGLIAGTALAAHYFGNECQVIGGEPKEADDGYRSLRSGEIETNDSAYTIADGLKTNLGDKNFPIIKELVKDIILVEEAEIISTMSLIWQRMKLVIEPSSAVPLAALLKEKQSFQNKKIGIILSGGNVDLTNLPF